MTRRVVILIIVLALFGACQGADETDPNEIAASPTSTDTSRDSPASPTHTQQPAYTPSPAVINNPNTPRSPASTPTATLKPSPTIDPWQPASASSGLIPNRRWLIFHREDTGQIGGFNVDGTGMTWFGLPPIQKWRQLEIWREWVAYITKNPETDIYELVVGRFPDGELRSQLPLHKPETDIFDPSYLGNLDWSPEGDLLAVSAALDGDDTNLYLFRRFGDYLERITFESGEAHEPTWSEDGRSITYKEFIDAGCGVYLVNTRVFNYETDENTITDTENLAISGCAMGERPIYAEALDSTGKYKATICIAVFCRPDFQGEGVYIQGPDDDEPRLIYRVTEYPWYSHGIRWDKVAQRFIVDLDTVWLVFNREGSIEFEVKDIQLSPDEAMLSIVDQSDVLTIYTLDNGLHELWRVTDPPYIVELLWIPNSNKLLVQAWSHIYTIDVDKQTVILVGRDLAQGFDIHAGYWVSQNP
ncbi:MAG: hypothetical protein OEV06_11535 [Anaerolineae bacterium]|nr:hypothetical protein [Anaerolineae bacterium]